MAKQQSLHRIKMYDPSTYRSVEQKVMGKLEPVGKGMVDFGARAIKLFYSTVALPFRIPTFMRRLSLNQTIMDKVQLNRPQKVGSGFGVMTGFGADVYLFIKAMECSGNGNYIPFIAWGATNLASGIYEWGRANRTKREYAGLMRHYELQEEKRKAEESKEN